MLEDEGVFVFFFFAFAFALSGDFLLPTSLAFLTDPFFFTELFFLPPPGATFTEPFFFTDAFLVFLDLWLPRDLLCAAM